MANLSDVLFPQARGAEEASYWSAWYPQVPYTGTLEQQREVVRLRDMEEQNLANTPQVATSPAQAQALQTMQHGVPTMQDGVAVMPPLQALGQQVAPPGPAGDAAGALQKAPMEIPVTGGTVVDRPALSMPPYFPPGVAPQELGWGQQQEAAPAGAQPPVPNGGMSPLPALSMPPYYPPSVAPQAAGGQLQKAPIGGGQPIPAPMTQPPQQSQMPAQPISPPATPEEYQQRAGGWQGIMENLKRPEVLGPLQTFFTALAAPLAPWETPGSRLGRASMMMEMHKEMLQQNITDRPQDEEMRQLELEGKRADITRAQAQGRKAGTEADIAEATKDPVIKKATVDLENAIRTGNVKNQELAIKQLELSLKQKFGAAEAQAQLDNIKSQIENRAGQLGVARQNANTMAERNEIARKTLDQKGKKLGEMSDAEALNQINVLTQMFRMPRGGGEVSAAQESGADFLTWYKERGGDTDDYVSTIRKLQSKGYDIKFGTSENSQIGTGMSGAPAKKPSYTLDAQGNLK